MNNREVAYKHFMQEEMRIGKSYQDIFNAGYQAALASQAQQPEKPHCGNFLGQGKGLCDKCANGDYQSCRYTAQAQQPPRMQFLDRSREKIITLLWQGICDGTVEAFDVNGMMVIPSEEGMTYVRKEDAISFFGLVEKSQAQQTERKWISVEERLPEDNSTVMAADQWGNIQITFYTENHDYFNHTYGYKLNRKDHGKYSKRFEWARKYPTRITHWMPLPPAPEGEKE